MNNGALNVSKTYTIRMIKGNRRTGEAQDVRTHRCSRIFTKPVDYIGSKTLPDYEAYVNNYIYNIAIPVATRPAAYWLRNAKTRSSSTSAKRLTW